MVTPEGVLADTLDYYRTVHFSYRGGDFIKDNGLEDFIQNLLGVSESLNWYSWFVSLYIFCMIVLPLIHRWLDEKPILATIGFSLAFYVLEVGILVIFNSCKLPITSKVLIAMGNLSVYMWFFHALFFTDVLRTIYQPFILVSDYIFIITFWTILLTYACSWILKKLVDGIESLIQRK